MVSTWPVVLSEICGPVAYSMQMQGKNKAPLINVKKTKIIHRQKKKSRRQRTLVPCAFRAEGEPCRYS